MNRCEGEKRRHIKVFVDRIRQEIQKVWDLLLMSDEEREQFGAFTSECYNEDLLQLHELELESLKETYEQNKYVHTTLPSKIYRQIKLNFCEQFLGKF